MAHNFLRCDRDQPFLLPPDLRDWLPEAALADSGYWSIANLTEIPGAPELLIPPARHARQGKPRKDGKPSASKSDELRAAMRARLASEDGKARYAMDRRRPRAPVSAGRHPDHRLVDIPEFQDIG